MVNRVRPNRARNLLAVFAVLVLSAALLGFPAHSRGAAAGEKASKNVAVVPGFAPPPYPGNQGVPPLTAILKLPMYSQYNFTQLAPGAVTTAALQNYDTVILYGIRWSDIPSSGQAAIDAFAATHKVVIWDADATGAQAYSSFVHPFSTVSAGQNQSGPTRSPRGSVVYFLQRGDFLASSNPKSPYYLDPTQLVKDRDELNDMNAIKAGTPNWAPVLLAANRAVNPAAWPIAWSYGVIDENTGMTIYSGLDADAFPTNEKLNNDRKELALDLAAPFRSTPNTSCSPHCTLTGGGPVVLFTSCNIVKVSHHWAHGHVTLVVQTSDVAGVTVQVVTHSGRVLAAGPETGGLVRLVIPTSKLPHGTSRLRVKVLVHGAAGCINPFQLTRKSNGRPRLLLLATSRDPIVHEPDQADLVTLRASETSSLTIVAPHSHWRMTRRIAAHRIVQYKLPVSVRAAKLTLKDRAGNTVVRKLVWG